MDGNDVDGGGGVRYAGDSLHGTAQAAEEWLLLVSLPAARRAVTRSGSNWNCTAELFTAVDYQQLTDPDSGEMRSGCTTVNLTPRRLRKLLGRYCAKTGQTAEEWIGEELKSPSTTRF